MEVATSLAAANEASMDAAAVSVLSQPDRIFLLKEEQRPTLKASFSG